MLFRKITNIFLSLSCLLLIQNVENTAIFGIGMRIVGDQLLLKDVLKSPPTGIDEKPTIGFNYAIREPITYIEILSEENILAEVNFSYNNLVLGSVTAIKIQNSTTSPSFEILITIYGFNETMLNVNPALLLNRDQQFDGVLQPLRYEANDDDVEYSNESVETFVEDFNFQQKAANGHDDEFEGEHDGGFDIDDDDDAVDADDKDGEFEHKDKIKEVGHRQKGDSLIYETYQTSAMSTDVPSNHSVTFYYIDSNYITYAKFVVFDHFSEKLATANDYQPPIFEYSHYSPKTLKAVVTDHNTTSLFVQMFLYGYEPEDLPSSYIPFTYSLNDRGLNGGPTTMSSLQVVKMMMSKMHRKESGMTTTNNYEDSAEVLNRVSNYDNSATSTVTATENGGAKSSKQMHLTFMESLCLAMIYSLIFSICWQF